MTVAKPSIIIAGGGLSGCLAALALAERRPEVDLLLLEQDERFGGEHVWSFFDTDIEASDRWLIDPLVTARWSEHEILFPKRRRTLGIGYNSVRSEQLDRVLRATLAPSRFRASARILSLSPTQVVLDGGETIDCDAVIDARGTDSLPGLDLGWQKFVGRTVRVEGGHGQSRPVIMDATVGQSDGYRFVYSLPFSPSDILVEDTYYSEDPALDVPALGARIDAFTRKRGWTDNHILSEERGVLPVALGGDIKQLWDAASSTPLLGLRGGFFHPTTGYSLPDAVRNAVLLAKQDDLSAPALHGLLERRAQRLWDERSFYRLLNRMLFRAAAPGERYKVLEHFYRLPERVIGRFYAGTSTGLDKFRILSGKPPVPLSRALAAMPEREL